MVLLSMSETRLGERRIYIGIRGAVGGEDDVFVFEFHEQIEKVEVIRLMRKHAILYACRRYNEADRLVVIDGVDHSCLLFASSVNSNAMGEIGTRYSS